MSKNINDLINKIKVIKNRLPEALINTSEIIAITGKGLAQKEIIEKGFGAEYSSNVYPAFFLYDKSLNKKGEKYISDLQKKATKDNPALTNWKNFRIAQGLNSDHVNLSYSSKMWNGITLVKTTIVGDRYICYLGHNNIEGQLKMNYNYERYGDFIGKVLTGDNLKELYKIGAYEIEKFINEILKNE